MKAPVTPKGHKRAQVLRAVKIVCECGWESAHWYSKGAYRNAHAEFASHKERAHQAAVTAGVA